MLVIVYENLAGSGAIIDAREGLIITNSLDLSFPKIISAHIHDGVRPGLG